MRRWGKAGSKSCKLLDEGLQKSSGSGICHGLGLIDKSWLERDIGFSRHHQGAEIAEHVPQMLLRNGSADGSRRRTNNGNTFPRPGVVTVGTRTPIDGVLKNSRNRAVVLGDTISKAAACSTETLNRATLAGRGLSRS